MKLPKRKLAYVPKSKLKDYLLSETHAAGRSKAEFFRGIEFDEENIEVFEQALLKIAWNEEVQKEIASHHGKKYIIESWLDAPVKTVRVRTIWIIDKGRDVPRFVTAYPI